MASSSKNTNKIQTEIKPRKLGRGLSSLLGLQVPIEVAPTEVSPLVARPQQTTADWTENHTKSNHNEIASPQTTEAPTRSAALAPATNADAPAAETDSSSGGEVAGAGLRLIKVGSICPNRYQPRQVMDEEGIRQLAASIRQSGLMQPIVVRPLKDPGRAETEAGVMFELVAGERRWQAARLAGLEQIPALVRELREDEAAEWALVENLQREDLNPMDRGEALKTIVDRFGLSSGQLADRLGLDRSSVANFIRLTELEESIRTLIRRGELTAGHAKALLQAPAGPGRLALADRAVQSGLSVRDVEAAARELAGEIAPGAPEGSSPKRAKKAEGADDAMATRIALVRDWERRIGAALGTKVVIQTDRRARRGKMVIEFYGLDHFDGLMERMGVRPQ